TAALFGLHPVATEAVTNLVGRADVMTAGAVIGGLLLHARASIESDAGRRRWILIGLGLVTLLGLLAKENTAALLGVVILYDLTYRARLDDAGRWRDALRRLAASAGPSCLAVALPLLVVLAARQRVFSRLRLPVFTTEDNPIVGAGFLTGRRTAMRVIGDYLTLLLRPR